ncbi:ParB/RepB/Spo0J family partition protein (plasmid) [Myxococcus stipitatus]|uniref:ParB/RepB/Spo0J family partition protein n=1 Tax=Myxococcus stipitatus TaxID=83455 RepID=UPI0031454ACF
MGEKTNQMKAIVSKRLEGGPLTLDDANSTVASGGMNLRLISLDDLVASPEQARKFFDDDKLFEQACSFLASGLLQPINVCPETAELGRPTGKFYIVAGERRTRSWKMIREATRDAEKAAQFAARAIRMFGEAVGSEHAKRWAALPGDKDAVAKYAAIPAVVQAEAKDRGALIVDGLIENVMRENLRALDEADQIAKAVAPVEQDGAGYTAEQLATRMAKDIQYVRRRIQLAAIPSVIRKAMTEGVLVTKRDEDGKKAMRGEGEEAEVVKERRTIEDMSVALELAKLYALMTKGLDAPQQKKHRQAAEDRFAGVLDEALSRKWGVRKLEDVRKEFAENGGRGRRKPAGDSAQEGEGDAQKSAKRAWTDDEKTFAVRLDKVAALGATEKAALRTRLEELLRLLG